MRRQLRLISALLGLGLLVVGGAAGYSAGRTYIVQPGDTLWAISRANGLTVGQLAAANGMDPNDLLLIGRRLSIPQPGSSVGGAVLAATDVPSALADASSGSANPWAFCAAIRPGGGSWGVLPQQLRNSPERLSLQPLFIRWASYYRLSLPLLEAIAWEESGWQPDVVSPAGAVGAGQILPGTAGFIASSLIGEPMDINSTSDNIRMEAAFLAYLSKMEGNNLCATIAAYYEGPENLRSFGVFPDTQHYVENVEALIPRFE